jgi:hypothetical protein
MDKPRVYPREPNPPDNLESLLIDEITQRMAPLGLDPLRPFEEFTMQTASPEGLRRQAERHEELASLYRRLADCRSQRAPGEEAP